jgi:GNAT superfamily N-acetyltransferase
LSDGLVIRAGGPADADYLLAMLDEAVAWLADRGLGGQCGTGSWTTRPALVRRVRAVAASGDLWIARLDGVVAGALALSGQAPAYVPAAAEPEVYIDLIVAARRYAGRGVGTALLDFARFQADQRGVRLLRVDCWAGGAGALPAYYMQAGFTPSATFTVNDWPGQVLEQRLPAPHGG